MREEIENFFKEFSGDIKNKKIIIACSGGPDSVALLNICSEIFNKNLLYICHYNHNWSPKSDEAELLVKNLADKLKINFISEKSQLGQAPTSENIARNLRYDFLQKTAEKIASNFILTAHQKDDLIETIIFRILRGTGSQGFLAIKPVRNLTENIILLRPLLNITKRQVLEYCQDKKLIYFHDESNNNINIPRNLIRHKITSLFESVNKNFGDNLISLANIISEENKTVKKLAQELIRENLNNINNINFFREQDIAVQRILLKNLLSKFQVSASFELIEILREKIISGLKFKRELKKNKFFIVKNNIFYIENI